jgi:hypothetical protein
MEFDGQAPTVELDGFISRVTIKSMKMPTKKKRKRDEVISECVPERGWRKMRADLMKEFDAFRGKFIDGDRCGHSEKARVRTVGLSVFGTMLLCSWDCG